MDHLDFRLFTTVVFAAIFGVFAVYHLLSYLILRHKILLFYFILILGLTLHWALSFFINNSFDDTIAKFADKASLTTAMLTTFGLLMFTKNYLNITRKPYPKLSKIYRSFIFIVVSLPVLHLANTLFTGIVWFNDAIVILAAITSMASIFLNIFAGFWLFNAQKFNKYYLYSYAPILLAALLYISGWFLKRQFSFNANPILLTSSILVTLQLILFSLLLGFKFKSIEDETMKIQLEANQNLISEVDRQTKNLQIANNSLEIQNDELERTNKLKNKLFSLITHDVRAPLNNISVIIAMIEEQIQDDEMKQIFEKLKGEISDKIDMVNGLLQWSYSQLEGIKLNKKRCDLQEVFTTVKNEFERIAEDKDITIKLEVSHAEIVTDENILTVILRNLISNAIKFSHKGQKIELWSKQSSGHIEIGVKDFGTGMDSSWFNQIVQGDKPQSTRGTFGEKGTGFGLLITKDFVEMLGGEIICESQINEGTNFILRFKPELEERTLDSKA
ncbi:sensor histidine kinase [[Muricauda] lutisoli]|uniref:histidine kinase n=1 Tax=[Muricauda] lutisoli TaxID=2816035 RepID=A0ABS3ES04_9FLAO|nr:sensor histidine kinase [[Muricauda] lutisoli]MBO0328930.1 sensor histidine kinase [[Muricauda] lutisoli]